MANGLQENAAGGITFSMPTTGFNGTSGINAGYSFDLPMATIQSFMSDAYSFTSNNSNNNRAFLDSVIDRQQAQVTATSNRAFDVQSQVLDLTKLVNTQIQGVAQTGVQGQVETNQMYASGYLAKRRAEANYINAKAFEVTKRSLFGG